MIGSKRGSANIHLVPVGHSVGQTFDTEGNAQEMPDHVQNEETHGASPAL